MHKITRPGQAAIAAAAAKDDAIDVKGTDTGTSAFPRAAGGLRKLFQLPAAANGDSDAASGTNGAPKPTADRPSGAKSGSGGKTAPAKGASGGAAKTGGAAKSGASGGGSSGGARRRNNKKRKRR